MKVPSVAVGSGGASVGQEPSPSNASKDVIALVRRAPQKTRVSGRTHTLCARIRRAETEGLTSKDSEDVKRARAGTEPPRTW